MTRNGRCEVDGCDRPATNISRTRCAKHEVLQIGRWLPKQSDLDELIEDLKATQVYSDNERAERSRVQTLGLFKRDIHATLYSLRQCAENGVDLEAIRRVIAEPSIYDRAAEKAGRLPAHAVIDDSLWDAVRRAIEERLDHTD